jgi:putative peptidoglycan lipid II flippase
MHPAYRHSPFSATVLLMGATILARLIGLVRVKYVAFLLGRSDAADAFNAAFQLPDMVTYFLVGASGAVVLITMLRRYIDTGREAEGERTMSVILTVMSVVLGTAILVAEFAAPLYVRWWFNGFSAEKAALCVHLTRILLPAQVFYLAFGIFGAVLLVHKVFFAQAFGPIIYNLTITLGGILFAPTFGVSALAFGALVGGFLGYFLINAVGAHRLGMRYRPILDWADPGLREWVRLSIPLMLGVSIMQADIWIINHFASPIGGAITLLGYAKQLFTAPVSLGQAAGAASVPFLAALFTQADRSPFAAAVNSSVSKVVAFCLLLSSYMIAMALPIVDLLLRGGAFHRADSETMAAYLGIFSISLFLWSAQAIYARAFYATGDTLTPMVWSTAVTVASIPVYWLLYRAWGAPGLAIASDLGITVQTATLAILLHQRRIVPLAGLEYREIGRAFLAASCSFCLLAGISHVAPAANRIQECLILLGATVCWLVVSIGVLRLTGSTLADELMQKLRRRG